MAAQLSDYQKKIHTLIKREERKIQKIEGEIKETSKTEQYKLWAICLQSTPMKRSMEEKCSPS